MDEGVKYFVGVDNGLSGGISIIDKQQNIILCSPMPTIKLSKGNTYDVPCIIQILDSYDDITVYLEESHTKFGNGIKSSFTNGELYGLIKGILIAKKIPFEIVKARSWQKELFKGLIVKDTKGASIEFCRNKYPDFDFTATIRSKKVHDGMTDSLCIANYGALKYK